MLFVVVRQFHHFSFCIVRNVVLQNNGIVEGEVVGQSNTQSRQDSCLDFYYLHTFIGALDQYLFGNPPKIVDETTKKTWRNNNDHHRKILNRTYSTHRPAKKKIFMIPSGRKLNQIGVSFCNQSNCNSHWAHFFTFEEYRADDERNFIASIVLKKILNHTKILPQIVTNLETLKYEHFMCAVKSLTFGHHWKIYTSEPNF